MYPPLFSCQELDRMGRFQSILFAKIEAQRRETDGTVQRIVLVDGRKAALCAISLWSRWQYPWGTPLPWRIETTIAGPGPGCPRTSHRGKPLTTIPEAGWNCGRGEPICFSPLFCAGRKWCCKSKTPLGWISCRSSSKRTAAIITAVIWTSKKEDKS